METELGDLGTGMISTIAYKPKTDILFLKIPGCLLFIHKRAT